MLIVGGGGGLGPLLAERAVAGGLDVSLAAAVEPERSDDRARAVGESLVALESDRVASADVLVAFAEGDDGRLRIEVAEALAAATGRGDGPRRLVYWGPHRVYRPGTTLPLTPRGEDAPLVESGYWSRWAAVDRRLGRCAVDERFLFRAVPVAGSRIRRGVEEIGALPFVPRLRHEVPFQLLHESDALEVLWRAVTAGHPGIYNVAGDGLLFVRRVARLLSRRSVPLPRPLALATLLPWRLLGRIGPLQQLLSLGYEPVVAENGRLKTHFGYRPRHTGRAALEAALAPDHPEPAGLRLPS